MKVTNRYGLPQVLIDTIEADTYDSGRPEGCNRYVTSTQLVRPPKVNRLSWEHAHEIEHEASDLLWALLGTGFHATREQLTSREDVICEQRFYRELGGWLISGKVDVYDGRTRELWDYKTTSLFAASGELKTDWHWQIQVNAWLMRAMGVEIESVGIIALARDWSAMRAEKERDYPSTAIQVFREKPLPDSVVESWVLSRLADLEAEAVRPCSDDERWARGGNWAVMKKGQKRALRLLNTRTEAENWILANQRAGEKLVIEERPQEFVRCTRYCAVAKWCDQAGH